MKPALEAAERELRSLVDESPITRGMTVRAERSHLYLGRPVTPGPYADDEPDDRVRFSHLGGATFGLSVRRHTGKWEKAPLSGTVRELIDIVRTAMQHLVAPDL
jgi:hypothetical protein